MGKHRLNKRQATRIKKHQQEKRTRQENSTDSDGHVSAIEQGLVVAHYGRHVDIQNQEGAVIRCNLRQHLGAIAAGDGVCWQTNELGEGGVVTAVNPRHSELFRYNKFEGNKLVAANVDQLIIVTAIEPPRALNVVDRYLLLAELQHIKPIIVFNKIDLVDVENLTDIQEFLDYYQSIGYQVLYTSSINKEGITELQNIMQQQSSVFVGLSGVGKSSLVNALIPGVELITGELSEVSREGNHTTTTARLIDLSGGGNIIDCPGIRELAIGGLTPQQVLDGFIDLRKIATQCQFRDCSHTHEPACAILTALEAGTINPDRFATYQNIIMNLNQSN